MKTNTKRKIRMTVLMVVLLVFSATSVFGTASGFNPASGSAAITGGGKAAYENAKGGFSTVGGNGAINPNSKIPAAFLDQAKPASGSHSAIIKGKNSGNGASYFGSGSKTKAIYTVNPNEWYTFFWDNNSKNNIIVDYYHYMIYDPGHSKADENGYVHFTVRAKVIDWNATKTTKKIVNKNWKNNSYSSVKKRDKGTSRNAFITFRKSSNNGMPGIIICGLGSANIWYDFYIEEKDSAGKWVTSWDNKYNFRGTFTYGDIDANQAVSIEQRYLEGGASVTNNTLLKFKRGGGFYSYIGKPKGGSDDDIREAVALSIATINGGLNMVYTSGDTASGPANGGWSYFYTTSAALTEPPVYNPLKRVTDTTKHDGQDEIKVNLNHLENVNEEFTYTINQPIPAGIIPGHAQKGRFVYSDLIFIDTLPECLELVEEPTFTIGSTNVTPWFSKTDYSTDTNLEYAMSAEGLKSGVTYGNGNGSTITMTVKVRVKNGYTYDDLETMAQDQNNSSWITASNNTVTLKNKAKTVIRRNMSDVKRPLEEGNGYNPDLVRTESEADTVIPYIPPKTHDITVRKNVTGTGADTNKAFSYEAKFTGLKKNASYTYTVAGEQNTFTADSDGAATINFTLKHGKSAVFKDIPSGAKYKVKETGEAHYTPSFTVTQGANCTETDSLDAGGGEDLSTKEETLPESTDPIEYTFTNTYEVLPNSVTIEKKVSGDVDKNKAFNFTLYFSQPTMTLNKDSSTGQAVNVAGGEYNFTLKDGESLSLYNIPQGVLVYAKETINSGECIQNYEVEAGKSYITSTATEAWEENSLTTAAFTTPVENMKAKIVFKNSSKESSSTKVSKRVVGDDTNQDFAFTTKFKNLSPDSSYVLMRSGEANYELTMSEEGALKIVSEEGMIKNIPVTITRPDGKSKVFTTNRNGVVEGYLDWVSEGQDGQFEFQVNWLGKETKFKHTVNDISVEAYAVFDSADGSLTFFRDEEGKYTNEQTDGTKTYYTGVESTGTSTYTTIPWYSKRSNVTSVIFEDAIRPAQTAYWFYYMTNLTSITGLEKLDTSNVTYMKSMFYNCENLTSLDVSHFDTSKVTSMYYMFSVCRNLTTLDVSHFDTSNVTDMNSMFNNCQNLTTLDVSHFDTSNVTHMRYMFNGCTNLTSLDVSHFDTSNVTSMNFMFRYCRNLTTTLNIMKMPGSYNSMCDEAATNNGAKITLKYVSPVTSANVDTLVATKSSDSNVVNGGQGTFVPPTAPLPVEQAYDQKFVYLSGDTTRTNVDITTFNTDDGGNAEVKYTLKDGEEVYFLDLDKNSKYETTEAKSAYIPSYTAGGSEESPLPNGTIQIIPPTGESLEYVRYYTLATYAGGSFSPTDDFEELGDYGSYEAEEAMGYARTTDIPFSTYSPGDSFESGAYLFDIPNVTPFIVEIPHDGKNYAVIDLNGGSQQADVEPIHEEGRKNRSLTTDYILAGVDTAFTNTKSDIVDGDVSITKQVSGNLGDPNDEFEYEVEINPDKASGTLEGEAFAEFDSSTGVLRFFRDEEGKYSNKQRDGTKTYYTGIETLQATTESQVPWDSKRENVKSVTFQDPIKPVSTAFWFYYMNNTNLTNITGLEKLDTSKTTDMSYMFRYCSGLTSLDVSHFDTSKVTNMRCMFYSCANLTTLDVSHFDTSQVTNMSSMFHSLSLTSLDVSHFDTSKVTNMGGMFRYCSNLTTTLNVMNMPSSYTTMCNSAATAGGAQITLKYISPVTSANIDTLVATKSSESNVVNGGQGTFTPPVISTESYPDPFYIKKSGDDESLELETTKAGEVRVVVDKTGDGYPGLEVTITDKNGDTRTVETGAGGEIPVTVGDVSITWLGGTVNITNEYNPNMSSWENTYDLNDSPAQGGVSIDDLLDYDPSNPGWYEKVKRTLSGDTKYNPGQKVEPDANGYAKFTIKLKHGESFFLENLPEGTTYKITEKGTDYTPSYEVIAGIEYVNTVSGAQTAGNDLITGTETVPNKGSVAYLFDNNKFQTQDLKVKKVLDGDATSPEDKFSFRVTVAGMDANATYTDSKGETLTADELGQISVVVDLKGGEEYEIKNLPGGAIYEITEYANKYRPSYEVIEDGITPSEEDMIAGSGNYNTDLTCEGELNKDTTVQFTNFRESTHYIELEKRAQGDLASDNDEFTFNMSFEGLTPNKTHTVYSFEGEEQGEALGTFTSDANGNAAGSIRLKHGQTVHVSGIKDGATYNITEQANPYSAEFEATLGEDSLKTKTASGEKNTALSTGKETLSVDVGYLFTNTRGCDSPEKTVSDNDGITWDGEGEEIDVVENTVKNFETSWTYKVTQTVPAGITDVLVKDSFPHQLNATNVKVFVDGVDKTSEWTINTGRSEITAYNETFSGSQFTLTFDVSVNKDKKQPLSPDGTYYKYENTAMTMLGDITLDSNKTTTKIPISGGVVVSKNVKGSLGDLTKNFEFTARFRGLKPNTEYTFHKPEIRILSVGMDENREYITLKVTDKGENPINKARLIIQTPSGEEKAYLTNADGEIKLPANDGVYIIENGDGYIVFSLFEELSGDLYTELSTKDAGTTFTSNSSGNATVTFNLHDDESMVFSALPNGATYRITESASDHVASYKLRATGDNPAISNSSRGNSAKNTSLATDTETVDAGDGNVNVIFTNTRNMATETGAYSFLKYWLLMVGLLIAACAFIVWRRKRIKKLLHE